MQTELGICYALNSVHSDGYVYMLWLIIWLLGDAYYKIYQSFRSSKKSKLNMVSNKYTGPGSLYIEVLTEANVRYFIKYQHDLVRNV